MAADSDIIPKVVPIVAAVGIVALIIVLYILIVKVGRKCRHQYIVFRDEEGEMYDTAIWHPRVG